MKMNIKCNFEGRNVLTLVAAWVSVSLVLITSPATLLATSNPVPVVIEGEALLGTAQTSGGQIVRQEMAGFGNAWSGNAQLFWGARQPGAELRLYPDLPAAGSFEVKLFLTVAPDFGTAEIELGGHGIRFDGYHDSVSLREATLGNLNLAAGPQDLRLRIVGKFESSTGYLMGIDRIEFRPIEAQASQAVARTLTTRKSAGSAPAQAPTPAPDPASPGPQPADAEFLAPWTTHDVIDSRIDVSAQYALMRMLAGEPEERIVGSNILSAVKDGSLGGIYQEDQQVPALRAQASGYGWWQILPKSATGSKVDSTCMTDPANKAPVIVMRKKAEANPIAYDRALQDAWFDCGLPPAPVRPYSKTLPNKQPPAKAARCTDPRSSTQLAVEVIVEPREGGNPVAADNASVLVKGPGGFSATKTTNGEGIAEFELPAGTAIYQLIVSKLPYGYAAEFSEALALDMCRNNRVIDVGWSRNEDPCLKANTVAQSQCWGMPGVLDGMSDCNFGYSNAQKTCMDYKDQSDDGGKSDAFEKCTSWAAVTYNQCTAPIYKSVAKCYAGIKAQLGCVAQ